MASLLREKKRIVSGLHTHGIPEGLEAKVDNILRYSKTSEFNGWRIYTKKADVGNDFAAFYGDKEEALVVKGKYGVVLEFVKEDLETIAGALKNVSNDANRAYRKGEGVASVMLFAGGVAYLIQKSESIISPEYIPSEPVKVAALVSVCLGVTTYFVLGKILYNKSVKRTALKLSDKALEYRYGESAIEELESELKKKEIKTPEILVKKYENHESYPLELEFPVVDSYDISYNGVIYEPRAYRKPGESEKELFYFNPSQERLVKAGYEMHPLANEAFGLICAYLDDQKRPNKVLNQEQTEIAEDMLNSYGEFFAQAIKTTQKGKSKKLFVYELVTSLPRNQDDTGYTENGIEYSGNIKEFDITDLKLGKYNPYKNIHGEHDDLIAYFTSRKFKQLPEEIKDTGGIYIPNPDNIWPVGRVGLKITH